ncbi:MAG: hypothetical protein NDF55_08905 [archaeon GB-1867-005]|nr:hypothetical protein [Candidatus Culexmicrobium cathedralense]
MSVLGNAIIVKGNKYSIEVATEEGYYLYIKGAEEVTKSFTLSSVFDVPIVAVLSEEQVKELNLPVKGGEETQPKPTIHGVSRIISWRCYCWSRLCGI